MVAEIQTQNMSRAFGQQGARSAVAVMPSAPVPQAQPKADHQVDVEHMKQNLEVAIDRLNQQMRDGGRNVNFSVDKELGVFVVRVTKQDTGEVIRQIPNEAVLKVGHSVEALRGMLHNQLA